MFAWLMTIPNLLIKPREIVKIASKSLSIVAAIMTVGAIIGFIITATPKPIKMKVGKMFISPFTEMLQLPIIIVAIIALGIYLQRSKEK